MQVQPYLFFDGRCEEAVEFYRSALGAEVTALLRFKDSLDPNECLVPPGAEDKVMHTSFRIRPSATPYRSQSGISHRFSACAHTLH